MASATVLLGILGALLPAAPPAWMVAALPPLVFLVETRWYALVALAFSSDRPRALCLGSKTWVDRAAGTVLGALGAPLVLGAGEPRQGEPRQGEPRQGPRTASHRRSGLILR